MSEANIESKFLYEKMYDTLKQEILDGCYSVDDKFPSEIALKERFSVNHLTIRKALAKLVDDGLIVRKRGQGTRVLHSKEFGAVPNVNKHIDQVCVLVESINEFHGVMVNEIESRLRSRGIKLLLYCHNGEFNLEREIFSSVVKIPKSLIFYFASSHIIPWLEEYQNRDNIVLGSGVNDISMPQILTDDINGSSSATNMLINIGNSKIGHISSDYKYSGLLRKTGYGNALQANSLPVDESLIENGSFTFEGGYSACRKIMRRHPDCRAFFCANDDLAFGAINYMKGRGLEYGKDFSIIGYGNTPPSNYFGLTTVNQNIPLFVNQFINLLEEYTLKGSIMSAPYTIKTNLILRESCIQ